MKLLQKLVICLCAAAMVIPFGGWSGMWTRDRSAGGLVEQNEAYGNIDKSGIPPTVSDTTMDALNLGQTTPAPETKQLENWIYVGEVLWVQKNGEDYTLGMRRLESDSEEPEYIFHVGESTNQKAPVKNVVKGDKLFIICSPAVTNSIPPQCSAVEVRVAVGAVQQVTPRYAY